MPASGTVKDPKTGKFVKKEEVEVRLAQSIENLEIDDRDAIIAALRAKLAEQDDNRDPFEKDAGEKVDIPASEAPVETLRLQSRYSLSHTVSIVPTRRVFDPIHGTIEPKPGLFAQFKGPQRMFDSLAAQREWNWTDDQRETVERKLLENEAYRRDYWPAPLSPIPDRLKQFERIKEAARQKICMAFGYHDDQLIQCQKPATVGRSWCEEHDPDTTRILRGGGTTVG